MSMSPLLNEMSPEPVNWHHSQQNNTDPTHLGSERDPVGNASMVSVGQKENPFCPGRIV